MTRVFGDTIWIAAGLLCIGIATARADMGRDTPVLTPCGPVSAISGLMQPPADPAQYWRAPDAPALVDVRPLPPGGGGHVHQPEPPVPPIPLGGTLGFAVLGLGVFTLLAWLTRRGRRHG